MNTGQIISAVGHVGLIGWLLFGGQFDAEPLPFEVRDVAVISSEEFEAMMAAQRAPDTAADVAMPQAPEEDQSTPSELPSLPDITPERSEPESVETPSTDERSEPELPEPQPQSVEDLPPEIAPPAEEESALLVPDTSRRPQSRPVERVTPEPVAQPPEPEAAPDEVVREETEDSPAEETRPEEEATAPEESVTDITPEASDDVTAAPRRSARPRPRPQSTAQAGDEPDADIADTVSSVLEEALRGEAEASEEQSTAPALSEGEADALVLAISNCWNVDPGSTAAEVTVVVSVTLNRDGTLAGTPSLVSAEGGDQGARNVAFRNARTAIIACGRGGFDLPSEKYESWREIEMTFNPEKMRLR